MWGRPNVGPEHHRQRRQHTPHELMSNRCAASRRPPWSSTTVLDHLESNRHRVWGSAEQNAALRPIHSHAHARSCNVREQMERRVGRRRPRQRILLQKAEKKVCNGRSGAGATLALEIGTLSSPHKVIDRVSIISFRVAREVCRCSSRNRYSYDLDQS